jgi:hypothetical protein
MKRSVEKAKKSRKEREGKGLHAIQVRAGPEKVCTPNLLSKMSTYPRGRSPSIENAKRRRHLGPRQSRREFASEPLHLCTCTWKERKVTGQGDTSSVAFRIDISDALGFPLSFRPYFEIRDGRSGKVGKGSFVDAQGATLDTRDVTRRPIY